MNPVVNTNAPRRVAVVGSRGYEDLSAVRAFVRSLPAGSVVISGGARGVDETAESEAVLCGLAVESWRPMKMVPLLGKRPLWGVAHLHRFRDGESSPVFCGRTFSFFSAAAHWRNRKIVDSADKVKAFWDGSSLGTRATREYAERWGKLINPDLSVQ